MSTTLWIADKMYAVDEEVREEVDRLNDEITTASSAFNELLNNKEQIEDKLAAAEKKALRLLDVVESIQTKHNLLKGLANYGLCSCKGSELCMLYAAKDILYGY